MNYGKSRLVEALPLFRDFDRIERERMDLAINPPLVIVEIKGYDRKVAFTTAEYANQPLREARIKYVRRSEAARKGWRSRRDRSPPR